MKQASALAKARKQCNANKQMTHKRRKRRKSHSLDSNEHTVSQPGADTSNSCWRANDASSAINANPRKAWRVRIGNSCHFYYWLDKGKQHDSRVLSWHGLELCGGSLLTLPSACPYINDSMTWNIKSGSSLSGTTSGVLTTLTYASTKCKHLLRITSLCRWRI